MFITRGRYKKRDGSYYTFYVLRATVWDKSRKRTVQRHLAYLGKKPQLPLDKARKLAKRIGITLADLRRVKGLHLLERDQA